MDIIGLDKISKIFLFQILDEKSYLKSIEFLENIFPCLKWVFLKIKIIIYKPMIIDL